MNAIVPLAFGDMERLAVSIAKSGLFGMKTPEQAIALMAIAQAEGRHPALAARDYDVIQGRPSKKAEAMMRDFMEAGGKVEWHALTDAVADATFSHPQGGTVRISWDMARGAAAGLAGKDNWKKFPRQMLRSRTVSEGVRTVWPLATSGMYVPEEAADLPPKPEFNGTTLDAEAEKPVEAPAAETGRDRINRDVPMEPARRTPTEFMDAMEIAVRDCGDIEAVNRLIANKHVQDAMRDFRNGDKARLQGIIAMGIRAHAPVVHPEAETALDRQADAAWPGPDPEQMSRERETAGA